MLLLPMTTMPNRHDGGCVQGVVLADLCTLVNYAKHSYYRRQYVVFVFTLLQYFQIIICVILTHLSMLYITDELSQVM